MIRLNEKNINTPELAEKIFKERWREQVHYIDWERFKKLTKYFKHGRYLDVGCFNSPMPGELGRDPRNEVWALDHCYYVIEKMRNIFPEVRYAGVDFFDNDWNDNFFDYIVAGEILEHMESPENFIKECIRILKPGGILSLSTPNNEPYPATNDEHLWNFHRIDIEIFLKPYGNVEIEEETGDFPLIYAWCTKK